MTWLHVLTIVGSSSLAALSAYWLLRHPNAFGRPQRSGLFGRPEVTCTFLFDDNGELVDATRSARRLLDQASAGQRPWDRLRSQVSRDFPDFDKEFEKLTKSGRFSLNAQDDGGKRTLRAEWRDGILRITLHERRGDTPQSADPDALAHRAMQEELAQTRRLLDGAPFLAWRQARTDGAVNWANRAYLLECLARGGEDDLLPWPLPALFPDLPLDSMTAGTDPHRATLGDAARGAARHYDCTAVEDGGEFIVYALPADAAAAAQRSMRSFVQTLSNTFAHLSVGLAVFDRNRRLVLFNPALVDLTAQSAAFLSAQPSLQTMLDAMRESHMIPEPKDYKSWRDQMAAIEKVSESNVYEETWSLADGRTYRVAGRPHPDGGIALLFEDISADMLKTRSFRADMALGRAVLDSIDEAVALFSSSGKLIYINRAYVALWGLESPEPLPRTTIGDACRFWQSKCPPDPVWAMMEKCATALGERQPVQCNARLSDGRLIACRVVPLAGGVTLVGFTRLVGGTKAESRGADTSPEGAQAKRLA